MHQDSHEFEKALDFSADNDTTTHLDSVSSHAQPLTPEKQKVVTDYTSQDSDSIDFNLDEESQAFEEAGAKIRVIGIGGGGCKAIEGMAKSETCSVDLIAINTDVKALASLKKKVGLCSQLRLMQLGPKATRGLGAGSMPENGASAAQESEDEISKLVRGCDMVFLTVGLGGGTGTGASPLVAQIAKKEGILTVAVATLPFFSEGKRRWKTAIEGMNKLLKEVDSLILVPNQKLHEMYGQQSVIDGFAHSDQILVDAVKGISDLIHSPGDYGGVDFADVRTCLIEKGLSVISVGYAKASPKCAQEALTAVLHNRMLEDCDISGAKGILGNIFGNHNLKMNDVEQITNHINMLADEEAITKIGTVVNQELEDGIRVVLVASGITMRGLESDAIDQALNNSRDEKNKDGRLGMGGNTILNSVRSTTVQSSINAKAKNEIHHPQQKQWDIPHSDTPERSSEAEDVVTEPAPSEIPAQGKRRIHRVIETTEEAVSDTIDEEDLKKPAYLRKPLYTNLGKFAKLNPFQD